MSFRRNESPLNSDSKIAPAYRVAHGGVTAVESPVFEKLLAELSNTFIRITADQVDNEIERWLRRIVIELDLDRSTLGEINSEDGLLYATHHWAREGLGPIPASMDAAATVPWLTSKVLADEVVCLARVGDAPREAAKDLEFARLLGVKSVLAIPLKVGGAVVGVLTFGSVRSERTWSDIARQRMRLVAEVFGTALERKRAVGEIRRFEREMQQVSRVAMMGELTVSLAHELNQPLGAVLSNAQAALRMLTSERTDLEEVTGALRDIVRDNSRAVEIVRQVRALFQRGEAHKSEVDLRQVVADVDSLLRHEAALKGISLSFEMPDSLPSLLGQHAQLVQLLLNLILNAFDAVSESDDSKRKIEVRANYEEARSCIKVALHDSGRGIASKDMPRLFRAFFTTRTKGIGMGLAISRSIVENHGGRLWAVRGRERGATFVFELPVSR
jgi:signal transduction histidine kinase